MFSTSIGICHTIYFWLFMHLLFSIYYISYLCIYIFLQRGQGNPPKWRLWHRPKGWVVLVVELRVIRSHNVSLNFISIGLLRTARSKVFVTIVSCLFSYKSFGVSLFSPELPHLSIAYVSATETLRRRHFWNSRTKKFYQLAGDIQGN